MPKWPILIKPENSIDWKVAKNPKFEIGVDTYISLNLIFSKYF